MKRQEEDESYSQQPRVPFMVGVAIILQNMTNAICFRSFSIGLGVLKDKGPAVFMQVKRLFGGSHAMIMDLHTFLDMAYAISKISVDELEKVGYTLKKKDLMGRDFTIPSWAFPRALLETIMAAREVSSLFLRLEESLKSVARVMLESGMPPEEVAKFVEAQRRGLVKAPAKKSEEEQATEQKPTLH